MWSLLTKFCGSRPQRVFTSGGGCLPRSSVLVRAAFVCSTKMPPKKNFNSEKRRKNDPKRVRQVFSPSPAAQEWFTGTFIEIAHRQILAKNTNSGARGPPQFLKKRSKNGGANENLSYGSPSIPGIAPGVAPRIVVFILLKSWDAIPRMEFRIPRMELGIPRVAPRIPQNSFFLKWGWSPGFWKITATFCRGGHAKFWFLWTRFCQFQSHGQIMQVKNANFLTTRGFVGQNNT